MFEFAVEILRVTVHGWNPVHLVQCHQVCLIFVLLLYCYNIMPTTMRSVTDSRFIHVCTNCKAAALVLFFVINVSGNVSANKKDWTTNLCSSTQRYLEEGPSDVYWHNSGGHHSRLAWPTRCMTNFKCFLPRGFPSISLSFLCVLLIFGGITITAFSHTILTWVQSSYLPIHCFCSMAWSRWF